MAKRTNVAPERSEDDVFKGDEGGAPKNGPRESGGGAGETTRLAGKQYRSSITDNPGSAPYLGGTDAGKGNTQQDDHGDANLYAEKSNDGVGDEHQESAVDQDVDDYYRSLSERRPPNYSKVANLQTKQAPLDLAPVDGGDGFVGSNTGPATDFNYITGKKGYSEDLPVWGEESTETQYPDESGSSDKDTPGAITHQEDSRDEFAPWKHVSSDKGHPQTAFTDVKEGGASLDNEGDNEGGNPNTQAIPSADSGDKDSNDMPKTEFTENDGGGAPLFKFAGQTPPKGLYKPSPRE